ncbi:MAG TPA: hypothetical protein VMN99_04500 [Anaerolineales bacterium]|nr:hypothetical protein [Anaerolineales bacterium]
MVHALDEIQRVLVPHGILIDIRPLGERWPVEVVSARGVKETGRVEDLPEQVKADVASNEAMKQAEADGWFRREQEELFPFFYSWDTPSEMEEFIADDWADFIGLSDEVRQATRSTWAIADADSRVRMRMQVLITRWKKSQTETRGSVKKI